MVQYQERNLLNKHAVKKNNIYNALLLIKYVKMKYRLKPITIIEFKKIPDEEKLQQFKGLLKGI